LHPAVERRAKYAAGEAGGIGLRLRSESRNDIHFIRGSCGKQRGGLIYVRYKLK